jgi:hypothetical protein
MRKAVPLLTAAVLLGLTASSEANVLFTFQENGSNKSLPVTSSFTESGYTLTATAMKSVTFDFFGNLTSVGTTATGFSLYAKAQGAGETGLGLTNDSSGEHEITYGSGILLDFSQVAADKPYTIDFNSVTNGERIAVYDATTKALIGSGTSNTFATVSASNPDTKFLVTEVTAPTFGDSNPNVLLGAVTITPGLQVTAVPEPSMLVLAGSGFVTLAAFGWLRRRKATA